MYQASEVAVKLAMAARHSDPDTYCREAMLAQQLRHPHVSGAKSCCACALLLTRTVLYMGTGGSLLAAMLCVT